MITPRHTILISAGISVALGFLAGFLGGQWATPQVAEKPANAIIQAQSFQITDASGRARGRFEVDSQGVVRLVLGDRDGAPMVQLRAEPAGNTSLRMGDDKGQQAIVLGTEPQGSQTVAMYAEGKSRLGLEVQKNGAPVINMNDKGKRLLALELSAQGDPHLACFGDNQKPAVELISKKNGDRSFSLNGKDGTPRIVLGLKLDQKAALGLFDRQGKTRVALMDEPSLFLLKNGKVVRTLP